MKHPIRVKIIARGQPSHPWSRQSPGASGRWGECLFLFDREEKNYDWLVVIDDVSRKLGTPPELLPCPEEHTILVTTEPPTITRYGKAFASQFHTVLTSQDAEALPHPRRLHSATGNLWFHGRSYDELTAIDGCEKTKNVSTVCSSKRQKHTAHHARYDFTQWLKGKLPELEIFGHGVRQVENKFDALDPYRFHLAIENYSAPHHWTEKLADPLLSFCVPIYHGCPNVADYLPEDCFIRIDINQRKEALEIISRELSDPDSYHRRLPVIREARQLILEKHNLLAILATKIGQAHNSAGKPSRKPLWGRKQMRLRSPADLASHISWKGTTFLKTFDKPAR